MTAFPFYRMRAAALDAFEADLRVFESTEPETLRKGSCTFEVEYEDGEPVGYRVLMGLFNGAHMDLEDAASPESIIAAARRYADDSWDADIEYERVKRLRTAD